MAEEAVLKKENFYGLEQVAEESPGGLINFIGIVHRVGAIGEITLKNGDIKHRRNVMVCDESNLSICVCFWSEAHHKQLEDARGKVMVCMQGRVSDFSHKSINASEDSKLYINPDIERTVQLLSWYDDISKTPERMDFHPLSGQLNVEN